MSKREKICKWVITIGAALLIVLFFFPWISIEGLGSFSGLTLAIDGLFLWNFVILALYGVLLFFAVRDTYFSVLRNLSMVGFVTMVLFEIMVDLSTIAGGLMIDGEMAEFNLQPAYIVGLIIYIICIVTAVIGRRQELREVMRMMDTSLKHVLCSKCSKMGGEFWKSCPICSKGIAK